MVTLSYMSVVMKKQQQRDMCVYTRQLTAWVLNAFPLSLRYELYSNDRVSQFRSTKLMVPPWKVCPAPYSENISGCLPLSKKDSKSSPQSLYCHLWGSQHWPDWECISRLTGEAELGLMRATSASKAGLSCCKCTMVWETVHLLGRALWNQPINLWNGNKSCWRD